GILGKRHNSVDMGATQLKGRHVGDTENNVYELFQKSQGKVILLDEAYALGGTGAQETDHYGKAAVDALVHCLTDPRHVGIVVIFAGYPEPMKRFIGANEGLKRRVPNVIEFP